MFDGSGVLSPPHKFWPGTVVWWSPLNVTAIVILFGLARRTARKSEKHHYFTEAVRADNGAPLDLAVKGKRERQRHLNLVIVAQRQRRAARRIDPVERRGRVRAVLLAELRVPNAPSQLAALLEMGEGVACPVPAAAVPWVVGVVAVGGGLAVDNLVPRHVLQQ